MGLYWNLGLCLFHLPRLLLAEDATSPAAAAADSIVTTSPSPFPSPPPARSSSGSPFRPSIAVIVGVLTAMFSLTFLLLLYAKHCKRTSAGYGGGGASGFSAAAERRNSGVERAVVESLPVFRFGSLRGQKEGLECAVCLNRFEPAEVLRLLPKCRHAFHVECVDTWLDAHSTCPLCRVRVDPEDVLLVPEPRPLPDPDHPSPAGGDKSPRDSKAAGEAAAAAAIPNPFGRRISGRHSSAGEKCSNSIQIVVHRADPANRRSADSASARGGAAAGGFEAARGKDRKDRLLLPADREDFERRCSHRIVVSCGDVLQERWSDLRPSDLLFLRSEMIITDSGRFSASRVGRVSGSSSGGGGDVISARCASEITGISRLPTRVRSGGCARREEEERTMRRWLAFAAKRTARWLGSRESDHGPNT